MAYDTSLCKRGNVYYFRVRIPADLVSHFKREDLRRTLRTKSLTTARRLVKLWNGKTEKLFTLMRTGMLTEEQIQTLVDEYTRETLAFSDTFRLEKGSQLVEVDLPNGAFIHDNAIPYEDFMEKAHNDIITASYQYISPIVDSFLDQKGLAVDKASQEYKKLCRDIALAHIEVLQIDQRRDLGDFSDPYYRKPVNESVPSDPSLTCKPDSIVMSQLIDLYVKENTAQNSWTNKSCDQTISRLNLFLELIGNVEVKSITRQSMVDCLTKLQRIPSNRTKLKEYKDKTVQELLKLNNIPNPLSTTTVKHHMEKVSSLFKWAVRHGHMEKNPAEGLAPRDTQATGSQRKVYSQQDLKKLVDVLTIEFRSKTSRPDRWWIPIIGLYSGLRLNEICQLYKEDVRQVDGIWCFYVNDSGDKKLKTGSGKRLVPIHQQLINLGFLEFCKSIDHERLWPNLKKGRDGYSTVYGKWFQKINREFITQDPQKVFHSFRHNFTDALKQAGVQEQVIAELVGHSRGSITMERYGKVYKPEMLQKAIEKLVFEIDFGPFK